MKNTLDQAQTPLDCKLEAVLPAVHQRFDAINKKVCDVEKSLMEKIDERFHIEGESRRAETNEIVNEMRKMSAFMLCCKNAIEGFAGAFQSGFSFGGRAAEVAPAVLAPVATRQEVRREEERQEIRNDDELRNDNPPVVKLRPVYKDLKAFYRHWYGIGDTAQTSIAVMEETTNRAWRKGFTTSEKIEFSKAKRIIGAIQSEAEKRNIDIVLDEWNEEIRKKKKTFSLSGTVKWLTEMGFVTTMKPRGSHATKTNE